MKALKNFSTQDIVNLFNTVINNQILCQEYKACSYFYLGEIELKNNRDYVMPESEFPYKVEAFRILYPLHIKNKMKTHIGQEVYKKLEKLLK